MTGASTPSIVPLLPPKGSAVRRLALILLAIAPFSVGALALFLGQDANWDLRNYHWYNAYAFLAHRYAIDVIPSQTPFFYNPTIDIPFYLLATHLSARLASFILASVQGLNFVLLFLLGFAVLPPWAPRRKIFVCALLAALGILGGGGIALIGTTFYDNVTSLGVFLSVLLVIRYHKVLFESPLNFAFCLALLSGIPAGFMMGLKLPSVIFCVGLCGALFLAGGSLRQRFLLSFAFGIGILVGLTFSLGPWATFLQLNYGSPLFPYFNDFFKSPWAPLTDARDMKFLPLTLSDKLLFPFIFTNDPLRVGEIPWRDLRLVILYVLLPLAPVLKFLLARKNETPYATRFLLWFGTISYVVWLLIFGIYRYLIPLEMIAPLLIVLAVCLIPVRPKIQAVLAALLLLIIAVTIQPGNWSRKTPWLDHMVEVDVPVLPNTPKPMILMAGFEPYSHVIPAFPPEIPFVRIQSNFVSPDQDKNFNNIIRAHVLAHKMNKGRFMLLAPGWQHYLALEALKLYNLTILPQTCQKVVDHLFDSQLELCDVAQIPNEGKHD